MTIPEQSRINTIGGTIILNECNEEEIAEPDRRTWSVSEQSTNINKDYPINLVAKGVKQEKLTIQIP